MRELGGKLTNGKQFIWALWYSRESIIASINPFQPGNFGTPSHWAHIQNNSSKVKAEVWFNIGLNLSKSCNIIFELVLSDFSKEIIVIDVILLIVSAVVAVYTLFIRWFKHTASARTTHWIPPIEWKVLYPFIVLMLKSALSKKNCEKLFLAIWGCRWSNEDDSKTYTSL